jgi:Ca2+-transporting ATPase
LIPDQAALTPALAADLDECQLSQLSSSDLLALLDTDVSKGLSSNIARARLKAFGGNEIEKHKKQSWLLILIGQFQSSVVVLLLVAAIISYMGHEVLQAWGILIAVLINAGVGFFMELRAKTSLEALARLSGSTVRSRRDGRETELPVRELVPGDIVVLEHGSRIPADVRFVEAARLSVDESAMTGESVPVWKCHEWSELETEYSTLGFQGTMVVGGRAVAVVSATGAKTRLGRLGKLVASTTAGETPLKRRLEVLGRQLSILTVVVSVAVTAIGIWQKQNAWLMLQTGIALAVAAVPEGLPVLATLALAIGTQRMVKARALLRSLAAVETLGCTNVICTDKTGTLTENQMSVTEVVFGRHCVRISGGGYEPIGEFRERDEILEPGRQPSLLDLLRTGALCNDSNIQQTEEGWTAHGDPTEAALIAAATKAGLAKDLLVGQFRRVGEFPFELKRKRMTTVHETADGRLFACIKGSPEVLFSLASSWASHNSKQEFAGDDRLWFIEQNERLARQGLRVLAIGVKELTDKPACLDQNMIEQDITLLGLVGMCDRPKPGVKEAIAQCHDAGIRVIMVTGDQKATARSVAEELNIISRDAPESAVLSGEQLERLNSEELAGALAQASVIARVTPEMKLSVVRSLQGQGEVVAMTGDGVNDAPALKQANIGVAMGRRGTDLAREVSEMIITDDNFASIVKAIEQGRVIYGNIQRAVGYLLTASITAVSTIAFGVIFNTGLPLTPLQLLWLNLIMHIFPGLGIVLQKAEKGIMTQPPRGGQEDLLGKHEQVQIWVRSIIVSLAIIGILEIHTRLSGDAPCVTTVGLTGISMALLFQAWSWLEVNTKAKGKGMSVNWPMAINMAIAYGLLLSAVYLPGLREVLGTFPLTGTQILYIGLLSGASFVLTIFAGRIVNSYFQRRAWGQAMSGKQIAG